MIQAVVKEPEIERIILVDGRANGASSARSSQEPWPQAG